MTRWTIATLIALAMAPAPAGAQVLGTAPQLPPDSPFLGSRPSGTPTTQPLPLSLKDAVDRALDHNLGLLIQEEAVQHARGARWRALAALLPDVSASVGESRQVLNLAAFGFETDEPIVGPFNVFDARVAVSQPVIDVSALNDAKAASLNERAARYGINTARDLVTLVAVNLYLETIAAQSRIEMTRAQQETADALLTQARDLERSGLVAGIDVLRAQVQQQTQRQRMIVAENQFEKSKLQLARAIGLPPGQPVTLTDRIPFAPTPEPTLDQALARAYASRSDYLAAQSRLEAAQATARSAAAAHLPSLHVDANYGALGQTTHEAHSTYTVSANVRIPLFDAGRMTARRIDAAAEVRQRTAELADFKARIEFEVRSALLDLRAAEQQLQVAQTNVQLANDELQQARDRFAAGVASNLEVTQAQESVASASESHISALYAHNLAKASLARALGIAEEAIAAYLGGRQ
ncbi:MAG TPA: TolC family protein [Vicinamibacterales bacterium]|nr:TolC family protein [Vicinamibacterales bacterium]